MKVIINCGTYQQIIRALWRTVDVLLLPTTGTIYTIAEVEADPVKLNTNLGYYTNFVNLLDLCRLGCSQWISQEWPSDGDYIDGSLIPR